MEELEADFQLKVKSDLRLFVVQIIPSHSIIYY
jgi:hypothetical protein